MSWEFVKNISVGGLINIGFISNSDFLIVVSHNGRGIFDCSNGEKLARDYAEILNVFDDETGIVDGFDFLSGQKIQTNGLFAGDKLTKETQDDWTLELENEEIILSSKNSLQRFIVGNCELCELKAFGFSDKHKYFVIATSCDLTIHKRKND